MNKYNETNLDNPEKLINFACELGMRLIRNGAEMYRVEESIDIVLKSYGIKVSEIFAIPSLVLINFTYNNQNYTKLMRVKGYINNLTKLALLNDLSREVNSNNISLDCAVEKLHFIANMPGYKCYVSRISYGAVAMLFTLFWGGNIIDSIIALFAGVIVNICNNYNAKNDINIFFANVISGTMLSVMPILLSYLFPIINLDMIIIGVIMLLVPGIAIANVLRDMLAGDILTAMSRFSEVIIAGIGIAIGIAIPSGIFNFIFRG